MNTKSQISSFKKSLFFVMGILVAVFVVAQEVIDYHCVKISADIENAESEDTAENGDQKVVYEYTCELAMPSSTVELQAFVPVFICSVIRESEENVVPYQTVALSASPLYINLFRQIISPNAP
ncbi:MAG: hypothetical protein COW03_12715 [Cytophagales bacterium CG12_big_fil_rev_8_21_14_0_65_40_12]|nr:MAG: hypothetical protein COW03_12715 [Cytophagales bacterium CG12_big_fil_rev_8_21_14_0_65_40_12]PIW03006.1 MAG: hypothetical protein COW40_16795 [Cytophagales bacterium CG17_big_fil_post_rev_8_21_14_2_50_40_13]